MLNVLRRGCPLVTSFGRQQQQQQQRRAAANIPWYEKPRTQKPVHVCVPDEMPKYLVGFNDIPELENANEMVQSIFSLQMGTKHDFRQAVSEANKNIYSTELERNIVDNTYQIRTLTDQLRVNKKDKGNKQYLIKLIQRRKKMLRKLQDEDRAAYHDLITKLEIPALQEYWDNHHRYKFRKFKINVPLEKKRHIDDFEEELVL